MDAVEAWARWRPELEKAASGGHQTIESIEADIREGHAKLWATDDCCMVVEFRRYAGGAFACRILWAAGDIEALKRDVWKLEEGAKSIGCTELQIEGRPGWERIARDNGFRPWAVTVRKEL